MQNDERHDSISSDPTRQFNITFPNHLYSNQPSIEPSSSSSINQIKNDRTSSFESNHPLNLKSELHHEESFEIDDDDDDQDFKINHIVSKILCLDSNGQRLPYNLNQLKSLQSVWNSNHHQFNSNRFDLQNQQNQQKVWFNEENQTLELNWFKDLRETVLFNGSTLIDQKKIDLVKEEEELVFEIQQNLRSLVNELNQDQWLYPSPTAFSPSLSIQSNSLHLGLEGTSSEIIHHERYLETEFNLHSLPASEEQEEDLFLPPRQLWLGEEEDQGLESDVSLIDLLNTTPTTQHHHHQSENRNGNFRSGNSNQAHLFRTNLLQQRHAQGSALAREVGRLGMSE